MTDTSWPALGPTVPVALLPVVAGLLAGAVVGGTLSGTVPGAWVLTAAVAAAVAVVLRPGPATTLVVVLGVALHQALQAPAPVRAWFFVLLAGLHLLHVLAALSAALPRRGWLQLAALGRPLGRWAAVQAVVQVAAVAVLAVGPGLTGPLGSAAPAAGVVGAAALLVAVLALVRPLLRRPPR